MKKLVVIIASCLSLNAFSQTNTFPTTGNVGIGTTTPNQNLVVSRSLTNAHWNAICIANLGSWSTTPGMHSNLIFTDATQTSHTVAAMGSTYENGLGRIDFHSFYNNAYNTDNQISMSINVNGVGIGTTAPTQKLDVLGNIKMNSFTTVNGSPSMFNTDQITRLTFNVNTATNALIYYYNQSTTAFQTLSLGSSNPAYCINIRPSGNVGIGTSNPAYKLDVTGDINISSGSSFRIGGVPISTGGSSQWLAGSNCIYYSSGNVGIGTTNPGNYKLAVEGTIGAREVKVTTAAWADFVFHPSYKLRTLGEVEQFIKANNHLPEIPTEAEVKENGVGLGEMNARLLQKIEELTLYMIEQQKQINELKEQNLKFSKDLETIKK